MLTRFAPSPTGYMHIGNARTALVCFLYARKAGGKFMLRLDDTDTERSRAEFAAAMEEDMRWLGLEWDSFARQSERIAKYEAVKEKLLTAGRIYPCYESGMELDIKRKMQLSRGLPPIYDRAALKLSTAERAEFEQQGRKPHYRFLMADGDIAWDDEVRGPTKFEAKHIGDPIIIRENGMYTYMLPSVVDDAEFGVTHVVRGEDHVTNTAVQIQMFEALGAAIPKFAHLALIKSKEGKISKREGGFEIRSMRADGIEPMAIASFLARIGTSEGIEPRGSMAELIAEFDIHKFGRAPANYDFAEIERLNEKLLHGLDYAEVKPRLAEIGLGEVTEAFWKAARANIKTLGDLKNWWAICEGDVPVYAEDAEFLTQAKQVFPAGELVETSWNIWIDAVKAATGRKGKELFMPLRLALTGMEHGPELKNLLPLIGREKALKRLSGA